MLTIIVPLFNEREGLRTGFFEQWKLFLFNLNQETNSDKLENNLKSFISNCQIIFCLWALNFEQMESEKTILEDSISRLQLQNFFNTLCIESHFGPNPSVVNSLKLAWRGSGPKSNFVLLHPVDCILCKSGWKEIKNFCNSETNSANSWAVFQKKYSPSGYICVSEFLQNKFFVRYLKQNCWTNLFLIPTKAFEECFSVTGFLEDLDGNLNLRNKFGPPLHLAGPVLVSSRKYNKRGQIRQMMRNCFIFFQYLLQSKKRSELRNLHDGEVTIGE
jgi:hypothetical protein